MKPRLRAVVLCAGEGRRLRPLTHFLPKPLLPVAGRPVVEHTLARLKAVGCEAVAVNLHHLGESIRRRLGEAWEGMPIATSEERELLGTLGALGPLRSFVEAADLILLVNGDSLCRWPLRRLVRRHLRSGAAATLLLARRADPAAFEGGVLVGRGGRILALRGGRAPAAGEKRRVFAGAHVFAPSLLSRATKPLAGESADSIVDLYEPLLAAGERLQAVETGRPWFDLGTPARYLAAVLAAVRGHPLSRRGFVAAGAQVARDARLTRSALESGARVGTGARLARSLLLAGARVGAKSKLAYSILGPGVELPDGASLTARLATAARSDLPVPPGASIVGGVVYSPLEATS
jgi:NDP-sugar pyrophosphorylase family protein